MQVLFCDTQISHAPDDEMSAITNDPDFLQLMCEAGETRILTVSMLSLFPQRFSQINHITVTETITEKGNTVTQQNPQTGQQARLNKNVSFGPSLTKFLPLRVPRSINTTTKHQKCPPKRSNNPCPVIPPSKWEHFPSHCHSMKCTLRAPYFTRQTLLNSYELYSF